MGGLKTYVLTLVVVLSGAAAQAMPDRIEDRAMVFASCLGRWSAEREHGWLVGGADGAAEAHLALFETLLEAVTPLAEVDGPALLNQRITAKMAQKTLLSTAALHTDTRLRLRATRAAQRQLAVCDMLVLG